MIIVYFKQQMKTIFVKTNLENSERTTSLPFILRWLCKCRLVDNEGDDKLMLNKKREIYFQALFLVSLSLQYLGWRNSLSFFSYFEKNLSGNHGNYAGLSILVILLDTYSLLYLCQYWLYNNLIWLTLININPLSAGLQYFLFCSVVFMLIQYWKQIQRSLLIVNILLVKSNCQNKPIVRNNSRKTLCLDESKNRLFELIVSINIWLHRAPV